MDPLEYIKSYIQVRHVANSALKAGSKIMTKFSLDLTNVNNEHISNTITHRGTIDEDTKDIKGAIIFSNHTSFFDFIIIKKMVDCYCLTDNVDTGIMSTKDYIDKLNIIPYYREDENAGQNAQKIILDLVKKGNKVLVFPEGSIQNGEDMKTFKKGLFHLSYDNKIPMISMNITVESPLNDNYLESLLAYIQIPIEPPIINVYYNEVIMPESHSSFESFYDKCFESVSFGYYEKLGSE